MGAAAAPRETVVPDSPTLNTSPVDSSGPVLVDTDEVVETKTEDITEDVSEDDLEKIEQSIPYNRFREVNEKAKRSEQLLDKMERQHREKLEDITRAYEAKLAAASHQQDYQVEYDEDPAAQAVKSLEGQISKLQNELGGLRKSYDSTRRDAEITKLMREYPEADKYAVLGWHQVMPEATLAELMEKSHHDNLGRAKTYMKGLVEKKKEAKRKAPPMGRSPLRISEKERPKTLKDAALKVNEFFNSME